MNKFVRSIHSSNGKCVYCLWYQSKSAHFLGVIELYTMWASRKRILLWHTARNILAIFYLLLSLSSGCIISNYSDIQSKALSSPAVIVARVLALDAYTSRGTVQVRSVLKQTKGDIERRDTLTIEGLYSLEEATNHRLSAQILDTSTLPYNSTSADRCLSYVSISKEYILFINHSNSGLKDLYHTVHKASDYTKPDKKLIKNTLCDGCGKYQSTMCRTAFHWYVVGDVDTTRTLNYR